MNLDQEPKSNVAEYEILDSERVLVRKKDSNKLAIKTIYHHGLAGILCNDFETFIDFVDAKEVDFEVEGE